MPCRKGEHEERRIRREPKERSRSESRAKCHSTSKREWRRKSERRGEGTGSGGEAYPAEFLGQLRDKVVVQTASECVCSSVHMVRVSLLEG